MKELKARFTGNSVFDGDCFTRRQVALGGAACALSLASASASLVTLGRDVALADPSDDKKAEAQAALAKLDDLQVKLDIAAADYGEAQMSLISAQQALDEAVAEVAATQERISAIQLRLGDRARAMYRTGSASFIDMLLGSASFKEFISNWEILSDLNDGDAELVGEMKALKTQLSEEEKACKIQRELAQAAQDAAAQAAQDAQLMVNEMSATYERLNSEAQELLAQEEAAREAQRQREAAEVESAASESSDSSSSSSGSSSSASGIPSQPPRPNTNVNNDKPQSVPGELVIARAEGEIGKPYVWGACGPDSFDCSGLVSYCLCGEYGKRLGTTYTFYYWTRVTAPQPGDICVNWTHCGIYVGDGQMIHAPNSRKKIQVGSVHPGMIYVRY